MKQRLQYFLTLFFLGIFIVPNSVSAALTSENFVLEGSSVGSPNVTLNGTSTNYGLHYETGGLYQVPVAAEVEEESTSGGIRPSSETDSSVLGKSDSIKICHTGNGIKFVTLSNVQLFITLANAGPEPEVRGHDGHAEDIIPPFQYNFGSGVNTYNGVNWTLANKIIYNNNCKLSASDPVVITPPTIPPGTAPVNPPKRKQIVVCDPSEVPAGGGNRIVYVVSNPPCAVTDDNSVEVNETQAENTILEELSKLNIEVPFGGIAELLMLPIEVYMKDENGEEVELFDAPVTIEVSNPKILGLVSSDLRIMQPSEDGRTWEELSFEVDGDTIRITIDRPGELFVWFIPKVAVAADEVAAATVAPPFLSLEIPLWVTEMIVYLGLAAGGLAALSRLANLPFSIMNLHRLLLEGWHNLIALLTFKKRRHAWGTVYDSVTKAPLDPAYVELFDETGNKSAEAITDLDGRYGFLVTEGSYTMQVRKTNYSFPSRLSTLTGQDVIYNQLYFGGPLSISATVAHDIPMDPVNFDWNQFEKLRTKQTKFFHFLDPIIVRFFDLAFFVGFVFMLWQFFTDIDLMTGGLLLCYLILFTHRFLAGRPFLYGTITTDGKPLAFALVHIKQGDQVILTKVTDIYGRYVAIVSPETYTVEVEKRVKEGDYQNVFKKKIRAKHGIINARIRI